MAPNNERRIVCGHCNKNINVRIKHIYCDGQCKKCFHISCVQVSVEELGEILNTDGKFWFCKSCKISRANQRRSMNLNTTTATPTTVNIISTATPISDQHNVTAYNNEFILADINIKIDKILKNNESVQHDINQLKIVIEDYKKMAEEIMQANVELQNENENLRRQIINVNYKVDNIEQNKLENNILMNGVEENRNENITDITIAIAKSLNVTLTQDDIVDCYRVNNVQNDSGLPPDIVVKFKNNKTKTEIIEKKKIIKLNNNILSRNMVKEGECENQNQGDDINQVQGESRNIYICEQLTKARQFLFKKARDARRNKIIKYTWTSNGDILIRKTDNSKILILKDYKQLHAI